MNKSFASPDLKEGIAPVSVFFFGYRKAKNQVLILINASWHLLCTTVFFYVKIFTLFWYLHFHQNRCFVSVSQIAVSVWFGELRPFAGAREVWKVASHSLWDLSNRLAAALPAAFLLPPLPLPHGSAPRLTPAPPTPPLLCFPTRAPPLLAGSVSGGRGRWWGVARIWQATENAAGVDAASSERFLRNLCDPSSCVSQSGRRTGLGCPLPAPPSDRPWTGDDGAGLPELCAGRWSRLGSADCVAAGQCSTSTSKIVQNMPFFLVPFLALDLIFGVRKHLPPGVLILSDSKADVCVTEIWHWKACRHPWRPFQSSQ